MHSGRPRAFFFSNMTWAICDQESCAWTPARSVVLLLLCLFQPTFWDTLHVHVCMYVCMRYRYLRIFFDFDFDFS